MICGPVCLLSIRPLCLQLYLDIFKLILMGKWTTWPICIKVGLTFLLLKTLANYAWHFSCYPAASRTFQGTSNLFKPTLWPLVVCLFVCLLTRNTNKYNNYARWKLRFLILSLFPCPCEKFLTKGQTAVYFTKLWFAMNTTKLVLGLLEKWHVNRIW